MSSVRDVEDYPIQDALRTIDRFSLGQEGEPQLVTFGDPIRHYAWMDMGGGQQLQFDGQTITLPNRSPTLVGTYDSLGEMVTDLGEKAEVGDELFEARKQLLVDQGVLYKADVGPPPLPRTSAEEAEWEAFRQEGLSLDAIRSAARERSEAGLSDAPELEIINLATGEERTLVMDAATLIAEGRLYVTRGEQRGYRPGDMTISTAVELGELLKSEAAVMGIDDPEGTAVAGKRNKGDLLLPSEAVFRDRTEIAADNWTADGQYSAAEDEPDRSMPPTRSSLRLGGRWQRLDGYGVDQLLDAAQDAATRHAEFMRRLSIDDKLQLQPLDSIDQSFHRLRGAIEAAGFDFGYAINTLTIPLETYLMAVKPDGRVKKHLVMGQDETRLALANAELELERWQRPMLKKIGGLLARGDHNN